MRYGFYNKDDQKETLKEVFENAIVHTRGKKPARLLGTRRPSEPEEILQYRLEVYEPITRADFRQAINDAKKAVMSGKARLLLGEKLKADNEALMVSGMSFSAYVREKLVPLMFEDPNASLIFWPTNAGTGEKILLDIYPVPSFDFSERSQSFLKWQVGKTEKGEPVFYALDLENFYIVTGVGKSENTAVWYNHRLGYLPAVYELGGIPTQNEDGFDYLESYFCSAFAWGNKAIRYDSDLEGSKTLTAYPIREIEEEPCQNPVCTNGYYFDETKRERSICGFCNGKGVHIPSGAYAYIVKRKANDITGDGSGNTRPAMSYITPPVEGLRFLSEDFAATFAEMKRSLSQLFVSSAQSGTAKEIDRQGKYASIDAIAANVWENIVKTSWEIMRDLTYFTLQESTGDVEEVSVVLPETFREKTEGDLMAEVVAANEAGDRLGALKASKELQMKKYSTDLRHAKALEAWDFYDPLRGYSLAEKMDFATAGMGEAFGFSQADLIRSGKGFHELMKLKNDPQFLDFDLERIAGLLDAQLNIG